MENSEMRLRWWHNKLEEIYCNYIVEWKKSWDCWILHMIMQCSYSNEKIITKKLRQNDVIQLKQEISFTGYDRWWDEVDDEMIYSSWNKILWDDIMKKGKYLIMVDYKNKLNEGWLKSASSMKDKR